MTGAHSNKIGYRKVVVVVCILRVLIESTKGSRINYFWCYRKDIAHFLPYLLL